ncbi:MAG: hypothetical protein ACOYK1_09800 [Vampirovibrionia bacterium]|jgi:hypothetical protein
MTDFDFTGKVTSVVSFLIFMWLCTNFLINKVKSGEWKIPKFLDNFVRIKSTFSNADKRYKINIIQREILPDGSEILILAVDNRRILLSRSLNQGIRYLTDLETENLVVEKTLTDLENIEAFK